MPAKIKVDSELKKLLEDMSKIGDGAKKAVEELGNVGKKVGEEMDNQAKKSLSVMERLGSFASKTWKQVRKDLSGLAGLNAIQGGLAINKQFQNALTDTVKLNDMVRKLGSSFGVSQRNFASFQSYLTAGLGKIGLSADDAANTLKGLAGTGVRGQDNVLGYAKTAGMLSSLGNEKGKEGEISNMISQVIRAKGGDVNDQAQVAMVAKEVVKAMQTTGGSASTLLKSMQDSFSGSSQGARKRTTFGGAASIGIADQITGGNVSGLMKSMNSLPPEMRARAEAMGLTGIQGKDGGISVEGIKKLSQTIKSLGISPEMASQIVAGSEEYGDTILRLIDSSERLDDAFKRNAGAQGDLEKRYRSSQGLGEAFKGNVNRVSAMVAPMLSKATQFISDKLSSAAESDLGAGAVTAGSGLLAAMLAGGGLRAMMGSLGGVAKGNALQAIDADIQKVYVVNAAEIAAGSLAGDAAGLLGKGGGLLSKAKALAPMLGKGGLVGGAAVGGVAAGSYLHDKYDEYVKSNPESAISKGDQKLNDAIIMLARKIGALPEAVQPIGRQDVNVKIENRASGFKATPAPGRGGGQ